MEEIKKNGFKRTRQREIIFTVIEKMKREKLHLEIEDVYHLLRDEGYSMNLSTIYRNFKEFSRVGKLSKFTLPDGTVVYDANTFNHAHFYCINCGKIRDITFEEIKLSYDRGIFKNLNFKLIGSELIFKGLCESCLGDKKEKL